jgi:LPS-assembly protein
MFNRCKVNYKFFLIASLGAIMLYGETLQGLGRLYKSLSFHIPLTVIFNDTTAVPAVNNSIPVRKRTTQTTLPITSNKILLNDSVPVKKDSILTPDSLIKKDSVVQKIDTFDIKISKDSIDAPVDFEADDSMVIDIPGKKIFIYNKASVKFKDVSLEAAIIQLDQPTQILTAYSVKDSANNRKGVPAFKQGESAFTSDTIRYNFKTQRGLTIGTYTQEGEMFIYGEKVKRISPTVFFAQKARFTSCNYDTPHFAFRTSKVKFISEKMAVTGFIRPEFEGVPIPIGLPFGIFPMKQGRRTGFLPPTPVANEQLGFGLEGIGYYKTFGEIWDASIRANVYSYGSYNLFLSPSYRKRYHYSGAFNLSYMNNKFGFKGDPDYRPPSRNFSVQWNHSVDSKARPGQTFSASVNIATSLFNKFFPNNAQQNFNNQLNSSIAYQRTWPGKPFNLTMSANHNQNTSTKLFNVNLPDVGFTVNTIYPFQKKEFVGTPKWYEKLGLSYNGSFRNQFSFYDSAFSIKQLIDTFQWGAKHSIPIQLSLPALGPLQVGPAISFEETWYAQQFIRVWNPSKQKVDTIVNKGFYRGNQMSFGLNFSTALFGTLNFKKKTGVQAIRHVIRPSIGMSYKPDFAKDQWYTTQVDTTGRTYRFNKYDGSLYGGLSEGKSGFVSFTLDNNLEMKVKDKKDTSAEATKKVRIIDGFGFSTGYNLLADSFALSDFNFYFRNNLFEKISLTAGANITPYQQDPKTGFRKNKYAWQGGNGFSLGHFTSGFVSINTSFKSKPKDEKKQKEKEKFEKSKREDFDEQSREMAVIKNNPSEYADFNIPWSVNLAYSLQLNRQLKRDYSGFETVLTQSVNFNGDFNLTEKWKVQASGNFDIKTSKLQYLTTSISRDLHCWQLAINVTPIGIYRSFNITISPKSSMLRDLRINRTRSFYNLGQ